MVIKMNKNKIKLFQVILTILYLFVISCCTTKEEELRLRIIANSNSAYDQSIKEEVKQYLKWYLGQDDNLNLNISDIQYGLSNQFIDLNIKVERKKVSYEAKTYQNKIIPSGYYDTVLITIGKGEGKNFWTLLYPEFFNISFEEDHEVEYRSYIYDMFTK